MSRIEIGHTDNSKAVHIDLDVLLKTRLLIQANSGGGKSWLLRRFAEETFGKLPLIIIDPEGEFATLREKFGFVLVGKGGETPADPRSASLLAHKLLELRASAVCDIYELKPQTRHHWVKLFLESLVDAPKKLWRPTIVVVDEAHVYCPEKGQGESEAFSAMGDLVTRGRKRGFCAVFATQRLAKLSKNVSAEMLNRLVGQTFEDVDQDRAADILSIPRPERGAFFEQMKVIDPGYFWALGRAIAKSRILVRVGKVITTHPEPGSASYSAEPPPPPEKVKSLLPKLADLPKAAEEQAQTIGDLKKQIIALKSELRTAQRSLPSEVEKPVEVKVPVVDEKQFKLIESTLEAILIDQRVLCETTKDAIESFKSIRQTISQFKPITTPQRLVDPRTLTAFPAPQIRVRTGKLVKVDVTKHNGSGQVDLPPGEKAILTAVIQHGCVQRDQLSVLTGYRRSSRDAYIQRLIGKKLIEVTSAGIEPTPEGSFALPDAEPLPTGDALRDYWLNRLPPGEHAILAELIRAYPNAVARNNLEESSGYKRSSRDAYIQRLQARRLVESVGRGEVRASKDLFTGEHNWPN